MLKHEDTGKAWYQHSQKLNEMAQQRVMIVSKSENLSCVSGTYTTVKGLCGKSVSMCCFYCLVNKAVQVSGLAEQGKAGIPGRDRGKRRWSQCVGAPLALTLPTFSCLCLEFLPYPTLQWGCSIGNSPRPACLGLKKPGIKPVSLNIADNEDY